MAGWRDSGNVGGQRGGKGRSISGRSGRLTGAMESSTGAPQHVLPL